MSLNVSTVQYSAIDCIIEFGLRRGLTEVFLDRDLSAPTGVKTPADSTEKEKGGQKKGKKAKNKRRRNHIWATSDPPTHQSQPLFQVARHLVSYQGGHLVFLAVAVFTRTHTHTSKQMLLMFFVQSEMIHWFGSHYILQTWPWCPFFCQLSSFTAQKNTHICQQFF